jgi:hypothetical protein
VGRRRVRRVFAATGRRGYYQFETTAPRTAYIRWKRSTHRAKTTVSRELAIRAELLETGGPGSGTGHDELRERHPGLSRPAEAESTPPVGDLPAARSGCGQQGAEERRVEEFGR